VIPPAILGRGLRHSFGTQLALDLPELRIEPGRVTALVGPNGSGKSTLLWIAALLMRQSAGELLLLGRPTETEAQRAELRKLVTLVAQRPLLLRISVAANVAYGLKCRGVEAAQRETRVREALELVGASALIERQARELSGGEAQRVALARALVLNTPILLLDEPTAALDRDFRSDLEGVLTRRAAEQGTTIVIATHERGVVRRLAHDVIHLDRGRIVGEGEEL